MMTNIVLAAIAIVTLLALAYRGSGITAATLSTAILTAASALLTGFGPLTVLLAALFIVCLLFAIPSLRRQLLSKPTLSLMKRLLPPLSETEKEAIDAGNVWWDGELFSGKPDWQQLLSGTRPSISDEEQAFIDGPVTELCRMVDKWQINHQLNRLPVSIVNYVRDNGFLGMIIPKRYGGLEFSPVAQSEILLRLSNTGSGVSYLVGVPNSLGPGELLIKYGTDAQKEYYLPRLASGKEIPCFALTGPTAGSDATSIPDTGRVCMGEWEGEEVIGMRLNFSKRYITLSSIATLVGLAFRLKDPDGLIGDIKDYGITCALIPRDSKGLQIGRRHLPVGDVFLNGPLQGKDVFVPLSFIIGGPEMAGKGWRMLVNCLSVGRAVTLPTTAVAVSKRSLLGTSAYASLRQQFGVSIAQFEGIQKPLARIAGLSYIIDAARQQTIQSIVEGNKPSVPSAILKYHTTEMARQCVIDAMDIHAGKAVVKGPKNYIADMYESMPVAITVEGANILTRNLMIFGQGATRSHPYVMQEMSLAHAGESPETVAKFDAILAAHMGNTVSNFARMLVMGLGLSREAAVTEKQHLLPYYRHFNRLSSLFAVITDVALLNLNARLKFREMLSARLGDLLSMLFLGSMVIKQHEESRQADEEWPVAQWALDHLLHQYQVAFDQLMENWPNRFVPLVMKRLAFPVGRRFNAPKDSLEKAIVELVTVDSATRTGLTSGLYMEAGANNPLAEVNQVFLESLLLQPILKRLKSAVRAGELSMPEDGDLAGAALSAALVTEHEAEQLRRFDRHLMAVIHVDDFDESELVGTPYHEHDDRKQITG
ncbi:MAG: acyl-CoA dehydrogenase [gamma proteobacterium symbiont of Ctena orbiculata]|nr:acyl-CoA dehydrogenase [Candidatus Thiodiazotropha taylori]PUB88169.1 MAG: acyl-CoA dehydrogenase [gamma proteobacterium symbiont of Ctena orbiculata]MBT3034629.1 acyl-CoA dehydrogenase [Candidatus Thiodiazotropha taylori]PVV13726.1 MAG: acyl-CoA dehydrogenase [gamma proteobacterium symbiont of Ctena orbiculata]PVV14744.1 MAG: acyl-CoA dehydrogenase [gamma proteobacterium symbiont of Ctena orbiculata]